MNEDLNVSPPKDGLNLANRLIFDYDSKQTIALTEDNTVSTQRQYVTTALPVSGLLIFNFVNKNLGSTVTSSNWWGIWDKTHNVGITSGILYNGTDWCSCIANKGVIYVFCIASSNNPSSVTCTLIPFNKIILG